MRLVTFSELVPGMVVYLVEDVNNSKMRSYWSLRVIKRTVEAGTDPVWGSKRAINFIPVRNGDTGMWSVANTEDSVQWAVVDDQKMLDRIRSDIKSTINWRRDKLDELERFTDANL